MLQVPLVPLLTLAAVRMLVVPMFLSTVVAMFLPILVALFQLLVMDMWQPLVGATLPTLRHLPCSLVTASLKECRSTQLHLALVMPLLLLLMCLTSSHLMLGVMPGIRELTLLRLSWIISSNSWTVCVRLLLNKFFTLKCSTSEILLRSLVLVPIL